MYQKLKYKIILHRSTKNMTNPIALFVTHDVYRPSE